MSGFTCKCGGKNLGKTLMPSAGITRGKETRICTDCYERVQAVATNSPFHGGKLCIDCNFKDSQIRSLNSQLRIKTAELNDVKEELNDVSEALDDVNEELENQKWGNEILLKALQIMNENRDLSVQAAIDQAEEEM